MRIMQQAGLPSPTHSLTINYLIDIKNTVIVNRSKVCVFRTDIGTKAGSVDTFRETSALELLIRVKILRKEWSARGEARMKSDALV